MTPDMNVIVASIVLGMAVCVLIFWWNVILLSKQVRTDRNNIKKLAPSNSFWSSGSAHYLIESDNRTVIHPSIGVVHIPKGLVVTVANLRGRFPECKLYLYVYSNLDYYVDLVTVVADEFGETDEVEAPAEYVAIRVHKLRDNAYSLQDDTNRYFALTEKDKESIAALNLKEGQGLLRAYNCEDATIEWWADDEPTQKYSGSAGGFSRPVGAIGPDGVV